MADIFEQAVDVYSELIDTFKDYKKTSAWYEDIQRSVAKAMNYKANILVRLDRPKEALAVLQEVLDTYGVDKYLKYAGFKMIVDDAADMKNDLEAMLPIFEICSFHTTNKNTIRNLIEDIKDKSVIPVIGAGLSHFKGADYPLWAEFLEQVFKTQSITDITLDDFRKMSCKQQASALKTRMLGEGVFANEVKSHFANKNVSQDILENQAI